MKVTTIILLTTLSLPAMANQDAPVIKNLDAWLKGPAAEEGPVNKSINKWYRGNSAEKASAIPLLKRTQDLGVLWVTGQINQKEFCQKAEPLRVEIRNVGKATEPSFKPFIAMWSWCP